MTTGIGVYAAISACIADLLGGVAKDRRNSGQGFNFRDIDQFMNAVAPVIARNGLVVLPRVISKEQDERQDAAGSRRAARTRRRDRAADRSTNSRGTTGDRSSRPRQSRQGRRRRADGADRPRLRTPANAWDRPVAAIEA